MSEAAAQDVRRGPVTVAVMLATFMQALDTTIANVALPHMQGTLGATQDQTTWVLTSYIVAAAIMTPMTGWLTGRFGRKAIFIGGVAGFTAASALCGTATTLSQMVVYRMLQGAFGAVLVPLSQATMLDISPPEGYARAMAIWSTGVTLAPTLGPVLGGWLTENYSWRWVFYINLPVGLIAAGGMFLFMADTPRSRDQRFDFFGFAMLSLGVAALQVMLDRGQIKDWFGSTEILVEAALAILGFYLFIVHSVTTPRPFVPLALFADRNFVAGNVFIFIVGAVMFATLALLPPLMQDLLNYPVVTTGFVTAPRGLGMMASFILFGRFGNRLDSRILVAGGLALNVAALWIMMTQFSLEMDQGPLIWSAVVQGLGIGFVFAPLSTIAFGTLPASLRAQGTAFFSLMRNIGSSIGISLVAALLTRNTQIVHASLAQHVRPDNPLARGLALGTASGLAAINARVTQQAAMIAYLDDFKVMMIALIAVSPLVLMLRSTDRARGVVAVE